MFAIFASVGTLLAINVGCAVIALAIGFAAGVWFFGGDKRAIEEFKQKRAKEEEEALRDSERARMAAERLKDLAASIACDVGAHTEQVEEISVELKALPSDGSDQANEAVFSAIDKIVEANNNLKKQLEVAEKQISVQTEEIQYHQAEARTDSLTMLANRGAFDDEMRRRFAEWKRNGKPFSLLMVDIDHFKQFNDTHGHQAGDEVLRQVSKCLANATRDMDVPCRYGGEEFTVVMPDTDREGACSVAERVRIAVEEAVIMYEGKKLRVTASIGLAQIGDEDDVVRLIKQADSALYKSKEAGRNCSYLYEDKRFVPITLGVDNPIEGDPDQTSVSGSTKILDRLPNRITFVDELRRRVLECHRLEIPISVLHLKVASYDSIEKEYGLAVAQLVLDSVAKSIESVLHETDSLANLEEGQFVVMLPSRTKEEADKVAERINEAMSNCDIPLGDTEKQLSIYYGVASAGREDTAISLMKTSEKNAAKEAETRDAMNA